MPATRRQYEVVSVSLPRDLVRRANAVIPKARRSRVITHMLTSFLGSVERKQMERATRTTTLNARDEKPRRNAIFWRTGR